MDFLTGWNHEEEAADKKRLVSTGTDYQDYCGEQFLLSWASVKERIYAEARRYNRWNIKSPVLNYKIRQDRTNGCVTYGTTSAIEAMIDLNGQKGKEADVFRGYAPFIYATYHNFIRQRPSSGGCTLAGMMQAVQRGEHTYNWNSWNDERGKQTFADVNRQVNRRAWSCFAVLDIERTRITVPNWSLK